MSTSHTLCLTKRDKMCFYAIANNAYIEPLSEYGYPPTAYTLGTEVLSVYGILTEYRHRYEKPFFHILPILWYHIILMLQYDPSI